MTEEANLSAKAVSENLIERLDAATAVEDSLETDANIALMREARDALAALADPGEVTITRKRYESYQAAEAKVAVLHQQDEDLRFQFEGIRQGLVAQAEALRMALERAEYHVACRHQETRDVEAADALNEIRAALSVPAEERKTTSVAGDALPSVEPEAQSPAGTSAEVRIRSAGWYEDDDDGERYFRIVCEPADVTPPAWPLNLIWHSTFTLAPVKAEESSAQPGWQSFATAPRDGKPFLTFTPDDTFSAITGIEVMWFDSQLGLVYGPDCTEPVFKPTHWMPLPAAPTGRSQ